MVTRAVYNFQLIWLQKEVELPHVSTATSTSVCCVLPGRMRDASALPLLYSSLKIAHLSLPSTARLTSVLSQSRYIIQIILLLFGHFSTALLGRQWDHQPYLPYMVTHGIDWQQTTPLSSSLGFLSLARQRAQQLALVIHGIQDKGYLEFIAQKRQRQCGNRWTVHVTDFASHSQAEDLRVRGDCN